MTLSPRHKRAFVMTPTGNSSEKTEWRIQPIPSHDPYGRVETNGATLLGALLFVEGMVGSLKIGALVLVSIFGLLLALFSLLFRARTFRKNWQKIEAHCIDQEWKKVLGAPGLKGGVRMTWTFQLLCEFELHGKRFTVTPDYWSTFLSERRLEKFLTKVISPDGKCQLWVNPKNPLQAELSAADIKDFLLHLPRRVLC